MEALMGIVKFGEDGVVDSWSDSSGRPILLGTASEPAAAFVINNMNEGFQACRRPRVQESTDGCAGGSWIHHYGGTEAHPWRMTATLTHDYSALGRRLCLYLKLAQTEPTVSEPAPVSGWLRLNIATDESVGFIAQGIEMLRHTAIKFGVKHQFPPNDAIISRAGDRLTVQASITQAEDYGFDDAFFSIAMDGTVLRLDLCFGTKKPILLAPGKEHHLVCFIRQS